jgi:stage II sporulation protein GA (sporulation sigma-E factor processing peptidase)
VYYEFYIDVFFMENMILDYVALLFAGIVLKRKIAPRRIFLASFLGALGACILIISPVKNAAVTLILGYGVLTGCMVKIGYSISQKRTLAKGIITLLGITFLLGGIYQALISQFTLPVIPMGILSALVLTLFLKGYQSLRYKTQNIFDVTIAYHGKTLCVRGLRDTGNQLTDPVSKRPVCIIFYDAVKELLDKDVKMYYIPYHSIGKSSGLLPGMTLDYMIIKREEDSQRVEHPLIAVSKEPVNKEGRYQMILHPLVVDN